MNPVPNFDLVRVARDCEANRNGAPGQTIYDFEVRVDGNTVATWRRVSFGKGYELVDAIDEYVRSRAEGPNDYNPDYTLRVRAEKQSGFVAILTDLFERGRIPSVEDARARKAGWGRALLEARDVDDAKTRLHVIEGRAADLFAIVDRVAGLLDYDGPVAQNAARIVDEIEVEALRRIAFGRETRPFSKWEADAVAAFEKQRTASQPA